MKQFYINDVLINYNHVLYYLFKKKKKKVKGINIQCIINNFKFFKIIFFSNIYSTLEEKNYCDYFFQKYFFMRNFWYLFLYVYNLQYKRIKINIKNFFNSYLLKSVGKTLIFFNLKRNYNFSNLNFITANLQDIFSNRIHHNIIKSKKKILIKFYVKKKLKYWLNNTVKIKIPFFIFNNYKKKLHNSLVLFFIKSLKIDLNKHEYIAYWNRFYKYTLKRFYIYFLYIFRKLLLFLFVIYKSFIKLLNWKEKINNLEFIYFFFFNSQKRKFLKNFKLYSIYDNMYKLLNLNFFRKKNYFLYIFFIKKQDKFLIKSKIEISIFRKFIKFKIYQFIKLAFFILFFKSINIWMNSFVQLFNINKRNEYFFLWLKERKKIFNLIFTRMHKRDIFLILKKNYYIYDNIKKS